MKSKKIYLPTLAEIIFDESSLWQQFETSEDEFDKPFKLQWSTLIPGGNSRYLFVTDSEGKTYRYKVSLKFSKPRLIK